MRMPPVPLEQPGARGHPGNSYRSSPSHLQRASSAVLQTRANLQPAFGLYPRDETTGLYRAYGVIVFTLSGGSMSAITRFDNSVLGHFGLPRTLP